VNDRADVALAADADGVHLRSDGPPTVRVRPLQPDWLIGRSLHAGAPDDAYDGADYLLFGAVFESRSKPGASPAGIDGLRAVAARAPVPVIAIGGITPGRAAACRRAGAAGVAGIDIFLPASSAGAGLGVHRATNALRAAMAGQGPDGP
jgi:thiamine-phosphate diphosphorylase